MEEEKTVYIGRPSQVINIGIFIACIFIIPIPVAFWRWLQVRCSKLTLTNHRVILRTGVFSKTNEEIELYRVRDLQVEEPFIYRIFGAGDIYIFSTDKSTPAACLKAMKKPNWLKDQIRKHGEHYRQNRRWGTIN